MSAKFITFEGIEGSGKSTQAKNAADYLKSEGFEVVLMREPGGTKIGEAIRDILLDKENVAMTPETELLLYNAARVQIVTELIRPHLEKGTIVICDRFVDSTIAYQAYAGGVDLGFTKTICSFASLSCLPDLTFLMDSDVERGLERCGRGDRMELKSLDFHQAVRDGFLKIAEASKERFCVVNEMPIADGKEFVITKLRSFFNIS